MSNEKNAKDRILEASIELFSKYGFDATGIRKIVDKANVNISMVNYYFKSKEGILLELTDMFFDNIEKEFIKNDLVNLKVEERFKTIIKIMTNMFKEEQNLFRIVLLTNSVEKIEFNKIKAEKLRKIIFMIYGEEFVKKYLRGEVKELKLEVIGPALVGLMSSHFFLKDIAENFLPIEFDDKFYEEYPKIIADIFLNGVKDKLEKYL